MIFTVDIGGTFTDLAAYIPETKQVLYSKSPTTYNNFVDGIMNCVKLAGLDLSEATYFKHGTTLVINTLLERDGAKTAVLTTKGFRDILEIDRGNRPVAFDRHYKRHPHLVPRENRYELDERIDSKGNEIRPIQEEEVKQFAEVCRKNGIEAVAISFINSYQNPTHEAKVKELLKKELPDVFISAGTDISQKWQEFERTSTAVANSYVGPQVSRYINFLVGDLEKRGFKGKFFPGASNGGVISVNTTLNAPLNLVESGPVGGVVGTAVLGKALGINNMISFDMGGTTAKCTLIEDGQFGIDSLYYVGGYADGFPVYAPVIDIVEVGAGGGSIAWLDEFNTMHVGPRSAGSRPGPVAYDWGGTEPTITDANVVLGRLHPDRFAGGSLKLNRAKAEEAILNKLAIPLGYDKMDGVIRAAQGILSIATVIMAGAIKRITIERGRDPRDFVLVCHGGGGPLHAVELGREMNCPMVIIPPQPGNYSATGMLLADVKRDDVTTYHMVVNENNIGNVFDRFEALESSVRKEMKTDVGDISIVSDRFAEIRYKGQEHTVSTNLNGVTDYAGLREVFEKTYLIRFGNCNHTNPIEIVNLHLISTGIIDKPEVESIRVPEGSGDALVERREAYMPGKFEPETVDVYNRNELKYGFKAHGPAIIEEYGSTTLVNSHDCFEIGPLGEIRIYLNCD